MAWLVVVLVILQVFYAGTAILVPPGDWSSHTNVGHMLSLPVLAMVVLGLIGRLPFRFTIMSLGLLVLYAAQFLFLHLPGEIGFPVMGALHPVNALAMFTIALHAAKGSSLLVGETWNRGRGESRPAP